MKSGVPAAMLTALWEEQACPVLFVDCQFTTAIRRTNLDIDYYLDGSKYTSGGVGVGDIVDATGLPVTRAKIRLANADRAISAVLLANNEKGATVKIYIAAMRVEGAGTDGANVFDDAGLAFDSAGMSMINSTFVSHLIGSALVFQGELSFYEIEDDIVTIDVVNELIRWRRKTSRRAQSSCPWPFKGTECAYAGDETWCDQTYDRCATLANTDSFGGNRFLPSLRDKKIWWGRVQG